MNRYTALITLVLFSSCLSNSVGIEKRQIGKKYVETLFLNDSTYDGLTKTYTSDGVLESVTTYDSGRKNGPSLDYYANGKIQDSSYYFMNLLNGSHFAYDSTGHLVYSDFYFKGKRVGSKKYFVSDKLTEFDFTNLDGNPLFTVYYDSTGRVRKVIGEVINAKISPDTSVGQDKTRLLLYLLNPPKIGINYSLGLIDSSTKQLSELATFQTHGRVFIDTVLEPAPVGKNYYIGADYNDSINRFQKYHVQPF
jgi:hypothetical protein